MLIKGIEVSVEDIIEASKNEANKADFEALRGHELFKTEAQYTQEGVESYLGTDEGKKLLQPKLDSYHTKGLNSYLEKNKDKFTNKEELEGIIKANSEKEAEYQNKIKNMTIQSKMKDMFLKEGIKSERVSSILKLADLSKVSLEENGNLLGASDIVTGLKEEYKEWFGTAPKGTGNVGGGLGKPPQSTGYTREELSSMSDEEYYKATKK